MSIVAMPEALGYVAASFTTLSFVPQAWLTLRTRETRGISLGMYAAFTLGVALWLAYGIAIGRWPIIVANAITLALAATILATKLRVEGREAWRNGRAAAGAARGGRPWRRG
jgi:MtN3 and saliva related transmembrane protein